MYQILVVDDERIERNGIKMLLRHMQLPCEIAEAANGRDALEYLKEHTADILLTDVKMPFMDGIQLIEECKKDDRNEDMKCVIFSGCSEFDYARKAVRLGVSDYILKPVDPSEFKETITRVIQELEAGDEETLTQLHKELINKDWFMTLLDLKEYIARKEQVLNDYADRKKWAKKMLINIAKAGFFSSDRTIAQYDEEIWKL